MRLKQRGKAAEAVRGPQLVQTGGACGGPGQGMRWACTLLLGVQILSSGLLNAFESQISENLMKTVNILWRKIHIQDTSVHYFRIAGFPGGSDRNNQPAMQETGV